MWDEHERPANVVGGDLVRTAGEGEQERPQALPMAHD